MRTNRQLLGALLAAAVAAAGCTGSKGDQGPAGGAGPIGPTGPVGATGPAGVSTGTIGGTLTFSYNAPASGVTVALTPAVSGVVAATSAPDGTYTIPGVPVGVYSLTFTHASIGASEKTVAGVTVLAGQNTAVSKTFTATSPIKISVTDAVAPYAPTALTNPFGFNAPVTVHAAATGGTAPYTYTFTYVIPKVNNVADPNRALPAPTLTNNGDGSVSFTTGTFASLAASKVVQGDLSASPPILPRGLWVPKPVTGGNGATRAQFVNITPSVQAAMTYTIQVRATDANGLFNTANVTVSPVSLSTGNAQVNSSGNAFGALGMRYVAADSGTAWSWTLTGPTGSTAALDSTTIQTPSFIPDLAGDYVLTNSVTGNVTRLRVGKYVGSSATCGACHPVGGASDLNLQAKVKAWNNSAHGNHFFKYMEYDAGGSLVWKKDPATGAYLQAPTATAGITWSNVGPMTTFEFGMTGAEGSHYGASCTGCHTTGFSAAPSALGLRNDNFYQMNFDKVSGTNWTFPTVAQMEAPGAFNGPNATTVPVFTFYNDANLDKGLQGMQCEACHGPLSTHNNANRPAAVWNVGACAYCHDRPSNHDRVYLWNQSKHSGRFPESDGTTYLTSEAVVELRGATYDPTTTAAAAPGGVGHCGRCHAAQGFGVYLDQQQAGNPAAIARPASLPPPPATRCTPVAQANGVMDPNCPCTPASGQTTCWGDPAFYAYMQGLGLTLAKVEPQTCQTCHEPHSTELRIVDKTGPLASGFSFTGAGTGAICMVCHNQRNGARGDGVTVDTNTGLTLTSIGGPHAPTQADLLAGMNAYFVSGNHLSKHAYVADTCAGCHLVQHSTAMNPPPANTNHTFAVDGTICASCHGTAVSLEGLKSQFLAKRSELDGALTMALNNAIDAQPVTTPASLYVKANNLNGSGSSAWFQVTEKPASVEFVSAGRTAVLRLTFADAAALVNLPTPPAGQAYLEAGGLSIRVSGSNVASDAAGTTKYFGTFGVFNKTNWNYALVSSASTENGLPNPGANVVHNPTFVFDVLYATKSALLAATPADL